MNDQDVMNAPRFSDFAKEHVPMTGDKIEIAQVLNQEIVVTNSKIAKSKHQEGNYLALQFQLNGEEKILFTSSVVLRDQISIYKENIPFRTKIVKMDRFYTFT